MQKDFYAASRQKMKTIERTDLQSMDTPADGWYIIEAAGQHPKHITLTNGSSVELMQNLTPEVLGRVADAGVPPEGLLIDQDHLSRSIENPTEAMGWVRELALCQGDLAARIEWSSVGLELVKGRVYKHFSTVYPAPDPQEIAAGKMEPNCLLELALTNKPNNWQGQPPITNSRDSNVQLHSSSPLSPLKNGSEEGNNTTQDTQNMQYNPELLALLGLADGATDDEVLARVRALKEGADAAAEAEADALVNSEEAKEGVELTEEEKKECREEVVTNRARGIRFTSMLCQNKRLTKATSTSASAQRYAGNGRTPAITNRKADENDEIAVCNRANEIINTAARNGQKMNWWTAVSQARIEKSSN